MLSEEVSESERIGHKFFPDQEPDQAVILTNHCRAQRLFFRRRP